MDQKKIGEFIAMCRKRKKLTQIELAEQLGITDRSVSNWENGKCMPDYTVVKTLCEELGLQLQS